MTPPKAALHDDRQLAARAGAAPSFTSAWRVAVRASSRGRCSRHAPIPSWHRGFRIAYALLAPVQGDGLGHDAVVVAAIAHLHPFAVKISTSCSQPSTLPENWLTLSLSARAAASMACR